MVLSNVGDDSDHYPILSDIPLEAIAFQGPRPMLPAPARNATLKLPLTKLQQTNYKASTKMKTGTASRQLAAEIEEDIRQADAIMENVAKEDRLRSSTSTRDRLKEMELTEDIVLHYAERMSAVMSQAVGAADETCEYTTGGRVETKLFLKRQQAKTWNCLDAYQACLTQAIAAYKHGKHPETDAWLEDMVQAIDAQRTCMPRRHKQQHCLLCLHAQKKQSGDT